MSDGSQESTSHWAQGELYLDCVVMHDPLFVLCQMEVLGTGEMYLDCVVHDLLFVLCQVEESGEHVTLGTRRAVPGLCCHAWPAFSPVSGGGVRRAQGSCTWAVSCMTCFLTCVKWRCWAQTDVYLDCVMHDLLFVLSGGAGRAHCAGHGELYLDCVMHDLHSVLCQVGESGEHIALSTGGMYLDCVMHDLLFVLCQVESVEHIVLGTGEMYLYCVVMHDLLCVRWKSRESTSCWARGSCTWTVSCMTCAKCTRKLVSGHLPINTRPTTAVHL